MGIDKNERQNLNFETRRCYGGRNLFILNDNSTLLSLEPEMVILGTGTYKITIIPKLILNLLSSQSDIIGSCYGNLEELYFDTADVLVSTWQNCDGPRLEYRKQNRCYSLPHTLIK
jgi:hypothetical protein